MKVENAFEPKRRSPVDLARDIEILDRVMVSDETRAFWSLFGDPISGRWKFDT
jgi:hypothetical protein